MSNSFTFEEAEAHIVKTFESHYCHFPHRTEHGTRHTDHGQVLTFEIYESKEHFEQAGSRPLHADKLDRAKFSDPGRLSTCLEQVRKNIETRKD